MSKYISLLFLIGLSVTQICHACDDVAQEGDQAWSTSAVKKIALHLSPKDLGDGAFHLFEVTEDMWRNAWDSHPEGDIEHLMSQSDIHNMGRVQRRAANAQPHYKLYTLEVGETSKGGHFVVEHNFRDDGMGAGGYGFLRLITGSNPQEATEKLFRREMSGVLSEDMHSGDSVMFYFVEYNIPDGAGGSVTDIYVDKVITSRSDRRRGYAQFLLDKLLNFSLEHTKVRRIGASCRNDASDNLFRDRGFERGEGSICSYKYNRLLEVNKDQQEAEGASKEQ